MTFSGTANAELGSFFEELKFHSRCENLGVNQAGDWGFGNRASGNPLCEEEILPIPRLDRLIIPEAQTQLTIARETGSVKMLLPVGRPAAIYMMLAGLIGAGRGEENHVSVPGDAFDKHSFGSSGQVLCHFETNREIEFPAQIKRLGQVHLPKLARIEQKPFPRDFDAVNSDDIRHASASEIIKPHPFPAADV